MSRAGGSEISERPRGGSRTRTGTRRHALFFVLLPALVQHDIDSSGGGDWHMPQETGSLAVSVDLAHRRTLEVPGPEGRWVKSRAERGPESFRREIPLSLNTYL